MSNERFDLAKKIVAIDQTSFQLRVVLAVLAGDDGIVHYERDELADLFGVSMPTLYKRLKASGVKIDEMRRIAVAPVAQGELSFLNDIYKNRSIDSNTSNAITTCKKIDWRDVRDHYIEAYERKYGARPRIDHRKAKNSALALMRRYGEEDALAIIDVVVELYDTLWRSGEYTSPTFGATCGWLADKAIVIVRERRKDGVATKATSRAEDVKAWL